MRTNVVTSFAFLLLTALALFLIPTASAAVDNYLPLASFAQVAAASYSTETPEILIKTDEWEVPSALIEWGKEHLIAKNNAGVYDFMGKMPLPFNSLVINWQSTEHQVTPVSLQAMIRTREDDEPWTEWWHVPEKQCQCSDEFQGCIVYMTHFVTGADKTHTNFEVWLTVPEDVSLTSVRFSFADTTTERGINDSSDTDMGREIPTVDPASIPPQPTIISRSEWWGDLDPDKFDSPEWRSSPIAITHAIIHHTPLHPQPPTREIAESIVRSIWHQHANVNNWDDIGYNFLIDPFGNIYEGRNNPYLSTTNVWGAHVGVANRESIGIALIGNFHPSASGPSHAQPGEPDVRALRSLEKLLAWSLAQRNLNPLDKAEIATARGIQNVYRIAGHGCVSRTLCPGDSLLALLPMIRTNVQKLIQEQIDLGADGGHTATCTVTVVANPALNWTDVSDHWAEGDIRSLAGRGFVRGTDDDRFAPNDNTTRAEFAAMLVRVLGLTKEGSPESTFTDVTTDKWFYTYIETATKAGLVHGRGDGIFGPEERITRQEVAAMIVRALQYAGVDVVRLNEIQVSAQLTQFADAAEISPWAKNVVATAANIGIIRGRPQTENTIIVAPTDNASRAEAAIMIRRLLSSL